MLGDALAPSSFAGSVSAIAAVITSLALLVTAVSLLRSNKRLRDEVTATGEKVDGVHIIVNQQRTDMQRYIAALTKALRAAEIDVPADQSVIDDMP